MNYASVSTNHNSIYTRLHSNLKFKCTVHGVLVYAHALSIELDLNLRFGISLSAHYTYCSLVSAKHRHAVGIIIQLSVGVQKWVRVNFLGRTNKLKHTIGLFVELSTSAKNIHFSKNSLNHRIIACAIFHVSLLKQINKHTTKHTPTPQHPNTPTNKQTKTKSIKKNQKIIKKKQTIKQSNTPPLLKLLQL